MKPGISNMKWTISLVMILAFSICKGQETEIEKQLLSLHNQVKFPCQAVEYRANIQVGACNYELLINDLPVDQYLGGVDGTANNTVPINDAILKSGTQRWKLIVYPGEKNGKPLAGLSSETLIDIEIEETVTGRNSSGKNVETKLLTTPQNTRDGQKAYADAGKPIAVYEGTFKATVPYSLAGWTKGQDLQKEDSVKLQQEVLAYYQEYAGFYREKNINGILSAVLDKERERAQYFFLDAKACEQTVKDYEEFLGFPSPTVLPIAQYRMRFYGDGKIVALERTDPPNKGEPVTRLEYKDKKGKTITEFMYCYLMRNASGQLVMIR